MLPCFPGGNPADCLQQQQGCEQGHDDEDDERFHFSWPSYHQELIRQERGANRDGLDLFGAHQIGWAFAVIVALWAAILVTMLAFIRVSKPAGWMMAPYLAWVTFAAFLNFTLWRLNAA